MQTLIEQMVSDISHQALRLDEVRLGLFLDWLNAHSSKVKNAIHSNRPVADRPEGCVEEGFKTSLKGWFDSLSMQGLLWEHHLILNEIDWWRNLDPRTLERFLKPEGRK